MAYTQQNRLFSVKVDGLGDDDLLLAGFSGNEAISRLFSFYLDVLSQNGPIDFSKVLAKSAAITLKQADGTPRYFHGFVVRFIQTGIDAQFTYYQMELAPYLWKFNLQADCRIFHNKKVGEILESVFHERGLVKHLRMSLSATTYTAMEYCVQYRETDFNFVSRLMEQNGIFYFFEHAQDGHTLVVSDSNNDFAALPDQPTVDYNPGSASGVQETDTITSWSVEQMIKSGKYSLSDYNFLTPSTSLLASEPTIVTDAIADLEIFDYPGDYLTYSQGTGVARLRMQEEEASHVLSRGSSVCRAFATGYKFTLNDEYQSTMSADYVLTEIQHMATAGSYTVTDGAGADTYANSFTCMPYSVPFRPARLTPKPFVQGPQTAVVVGKKDDPVADDGGGGDGEEIWVDKYGRVTVRFFWDRAKACSCRVRVSQEWAGQGWGAITIPRVGQEVIVSFLEGDPDRPIVTGRVYNAEQTVPFALPDNQTQSGIKTHSTPKGTAENYNMIRFEDKKGSEDLLIHAEKTMHNSVETTQTITTGVDRDITVGGIDKDGNKIGTVHEKIFLDSNLHVLQDQRIKIERDRSLHVMGTQAQLFDKDNSVHVKEQQVTKIEDDETHHVVGNRMIQVDANMSTWVQGMGVYEYGKDVGITATHTAMIIADMIRLQANTFITLAVGQSYIIINSDGISINGTPLLNLNSPGNGVTLQTPLATHTGPDPADPVDPVDPP
jgi:type VI secretion system secreted protein VgrG